MQVRVIQKPNMPKLVETLPIKYTIHRTNSYPAAVKNTMHIEHIYPRFGREASKREKGLLVLRPTDALRAPW